jgi:2-deoxystreptamine N-acetyl-D-glucosaminyltransferase/2-deoxystreptamine glucosyltransferase
MVDLNVAWLLGVLADLVTQRRRHRVDVIHVHGSGVLWPLLAGLILRRQLRAKLVVTLHCSIVGTYHAMNRLDSLLHPLAKLVERRAVEAADATITLTERIRETLRQAGAPAERLRVVPDCIDVAAFRAHATPAARANFARRFRLPADQRIVLYVGRIAHEKGWPVLIQLAKKLRSRHVHFLVCGDGNEGNNMRASVRHERLADLFTITGFLPLEEIPTAMTCGTLLVLPSLHEEFGSVLLEAMTMNIPPVAFAVGGVPHVLAHGETGILAPAGDVDAMAAGVLRLLDDPPLRHKLAEAGAARVGKHFDLERCCVDIKRIYEQVSTCGGATNA